MTRAASGLNGPTPPQAFPLTGMQAGMLFHTLAQPEGGVDVVQVLCHLPEAVDAARLADRWGLAVERHEALRLGFDWSTGPAPSQQIHPPFPVAVPLIEAEAWPAATRASRLEDWLAVDRRTPFDLTKPPLFRVTLFRFGPHDHLLVWTFHHIALDGRALPLVLREVLANLSGHSPEFPAPPRYSDFLAWRARLAWDGAEAFWQSELENIDFPLAWAFDRGTPANQSSSPDQFQSHELPLSPGLTLAVKQRADSLGVTVNTFLQGAWGLLLGRASGLAKVCFGTVRACRHATVPRALETVGLFTNTLPIAVTLDDEQPVSDWLRSLREDHLRLRTWEQSPLTLIRQALRLPPQVALYETLLAFEPRDLQEELRSLGEEWQARRFELRQHTGLPLTLAIVGHDAMSVRVRCDRARVADSLAERLPGQFVTVLQGLVAATGHTRLGEISIVPPAEIQRQLGEFNATFRDDTHDVCLTQMVLEQARRTPDRVAVVEGDQTWTYGELATQAERLARRLVADGLVAGHGVGLWSDRSAAGVLAVLGVLLAGAHYVALPSDAPPERIALLVRDAQVELVLTSAPPAWLQEAAGVRCLTIAEGVRESSPASGEPTARLPEACLDSPFCVIYTSGTTGLPKGAQLTHRGFTNLLRHRTETRFEPGDFACAALTAPWHFDGSIVQMFSPLITGGTLVVCGPVTELGRSPWYHRLTALTGASSLIAGLVREFGPPLGARVVGLGAEPLPADLLPLLLTSPTFERLLTGYGVTESSCYSTDLVLFDRRSLAATEVPQVTSETVAAIGRPIANTQTHILDSRQRWLPTGVVGELYLGGVGVAQGYLNRPELNAQKFLPDPFSPHPFSPDAFSPDAAPPEPTRRLYRTGDLARWKDDGTLEFLGRRDHQVKFRGYRIELGEIEAKLAEHPAVRQAVVLVRDDLPGGPQLVGYLLPTQADNPPSPSALRQQLAKSLPAYMVPTEFVSLATLPLTPNGKIDRQALPRPQAAPYPGHSGPVPPRTKTQAALRELFATLLQRPDLGIDQNFFELGGHSLLAVRLFSRIEQEWGIRLPIETLLEAPSVEALAARLDQRCAAPATDGLVTIKSGNGPHCLFLMPSATGNTLNWRRFNASAPDSLALLGVDPPRSELGEPWMGDLEQTLTGMLEAIVRRQPEGPLALLGYSAGAHLAQELARRLELRGRNVAFLGLIDTGPLTSPPHRPPLLTSLPGWFANLAYWLLDNSHRRSWENLQRRLTARASQRRPAEPAPPEPSDYESRRRRFRALLAQHRPRPTRAVVHLFRARCQSPWHYRPDCLGWTPLGCTVESVRLPGVDHFALMTTPHVHHLARLIFEKLASIQQPAHQPSHAIAPSTPLA